VIKKIALLFLAFLLNLICMGQNTTARITILNGTQIVFNFSLLSKIENGITLNEWTQLRIAYTDTTDLGAEGTGWELDVRSNDSYLVSEYGSVTSFLPSFIDVTTTYTGDGDVSVVTKKVLSSTDSEIASQSAGSTINVNGIITISYSCGTGGELMQYETNVFYTDLVFTLKAKD
jgi:hypothetical protein